MVLLCFEAGQPWCRTRINYIFINVVLTANSGFLHRCHSYVFTSFPGMKTQNIVEGFNETVITIFHYILVSKRAAHIGLPAVSVFAFIPEFLLTCKATRPLITRNVAAGGKVHVRALYIFRYVFFNLLISWRHVLCSTASDKSNST